MILAALADIHFGYYLTLGMVATVNPCGFAMLPAYLSYFLGLHDQDERPSTSVLSAVRVALAVSAGFLAVFAMAGALVQVTSLPVYEYAPWISVVIGLALVGLGLAMLAGFEPVSRLPKLDRGGGSRTVGSMFVFGVSYAIASIGCTLPFFAVLVVGSVGDQPFTDSVAVFAAYAAGMTVVLTALTVTLALAHTSIIQLLRSSGRYINRIAGAMVAFAGAYVTFYGVLELRTYRARGGVIPRSGPTDLVSGWSSTVTTWINQIGAVRLGLLLALALLAVTLTATVRNRARAQQN
jgi:cytochrome c-type biogenesis protein